MSQDLPEDQLDRVSAADPQLNVALEASAGTGKTRVLVDRYVRLIQEGADPRHILAITFTRKAAGEMKGRIIEELRRRPLLWGYVRDRLFDIHIATIDAFCLGLLKEFPLEAGLDPDIELLDEVDTERLARDAVDEVLADTSPASSPDLAFLISVFGDATLRRGMRDFLRSRLVKNETLSRYVHRDIPRELRLDRSLRNVARSLEAILGGKEGVNEMVASSPGASDPRSTAIRVCPSAGHRSRTRQFTGCRTNGRLFLDTGGPTPSKTRTFFEAQLWQPKGLRAPPRSRSGPGSRCR